MWAGWQLQLQLQHYEEVAVLDFELDRLLISAQDVGIISIITRICRICRYKYFYWNCSPQRGLEMTFMVNRYCTLYIWFGTPVKQRTASRFILFQ